MSYTDTGAPFVGNRPHGGPHEREQRFQSHLPGGYIYTHGAGGYPWSAPAAPPPFVGNRPDGGPHEREQRFQSHLPGGYMYTHGAGGYPWSAPR